VHHPFLAERVTRSLGTRVTVVDDHALFAEAMDVALTLRGHDVRTVITAGLALEAGQLCTSILRTRPSVVLLDLNLGSSANGRCVVRPLTEAGVAVVVVTGSAAPERWGECLRLGARTALPKSTPLDTIVATIRMIGEHRPVLARDQLDRLLLCYDREKSSVQLTRARLETLSRRECAVLAELMDGRQVREIARSNFVSEATVRTQVRSILAKLGVSSQLAAVRTAAEARWREPLSA